MTPELKEKWAAALESGKYKQAVGQLRLDDDHMCCLGVLCDLIEPSGWSTNSRGDRVHRGILGMIDLHLRQEISLTDQSAEMLAQMNDCGKTFAEIATVVRELP